MSHDVDLEKFCFASAHPPAATLDLGSLSCPAINTVSCLALSPAALLRGGDSQVPPPTLGGSVLQCSPRHPSAGVSSQHGSKEENYLSNRGISLPLPRLFLVPPVPDLNTVTVSSARGGGKSHPKMKNEP